MLDRTTRAHWALGVHHLRGLGLAYSLPRFEAKVTGPKSLEFNNCIHKLLSISRNFVVECGNLKARHRRISMRQVFHGTLDTGHATISLGEVSATIDSLVPRG